MQTPKYENKVQPRQPEGLKYIKGEIPGVPKRDLNAREVILYGGVFYLTRNGEYAERELKEA